MWVPNFKALNDPERLIRCQNKKKILLSLGPSPLVAYNNIYIYIYIGIESGSSQPKPDEVKMVLCKRGVWNALFSLADTEGQMSIKNGRSPALRFFIALAKARRVARRDQGSGLALPESCRGCYWSRYDAEPEIGD